MVNLANINMIGVPVVDIEIDGCLIKGVPVDGEACINLMMEATTIDLGITSFEKTTQILRMVDQNRIMLVEKLLNIMTRIGGHEFLLNYIILRVLVGNPFPILLERLWLY